MPKAPFDEPFHVRTDSGTFVFGYDTVEAADMSTAERNTRAEDMGILARYVSVPSS